MNNTAPPGFALAFHGTDNGENMRITSNGATAGNTAARNGPIACCIFAKSGFGDGS
jgi:hypothetical protein